MKNSLTIIRWIPRGLCIAAILFISMFAFDVFDPKLTFWQQIAGFLIHLIPSFVLIGLLAVAWKWELIGGIAFAVIGLGTSYFIFIHNYHMNHSVGMSLSIVSIINVPFMVTGALFIISHFLRKKNQNPQSEE